MSETTFIVGKENLEVKMSRIFDAERDLVWKAHTNSKLIPQWWGPRETTTVVDKMEVKEGGAWRFINKDKKGDESAFSGIFKELKEPREITWTFNYEPLGPGHEVVETVRFEETGDGQTRVSTVSRYKNIEELEWMVSSGMEIGARETWDRLAELLAKQK